MNILIRPQSSFGIRACSFLKTSTFFLSLICGSIATAVEEWELVAAKQFDTGFTTITFNGSQFLAVGFGGFVITSSDGATWTQHNHLNSAEYKSVAYGNGRFVMVGVNTPILSSTDGINWQEESIGTGESMYGVFYGNNQFIATGSTRGIWTSPDGHAWTKLERPFLSRLNSGTFGNGQFVIVGHSGTILTSPDAVNWTQQDKITNDALVSVAYGNGVFVASSLGGAVLTSSNGVDWSEQNLAGAFTPLYGVTWGNGHFVTVGDQAGFSNPDGAHLWSSTDGTVWTRRNAVLDKTLFAVAFGGDQFVAVGVSGTILRSNVAGAALDPLIGGTPVDSLEGWFFSDWFGFYNTDGAPWLFHAEHGFIYRNPPSTNESMFVYDDAMVAWWWTSENIYPFIYAFDPPADLGGTDVGSEWLFYFEESSDPRSFGVVTGPHASEFLFFGP